MIKKLFLAFTFLATLVVSAQEGTSSPYSFYGLGEVKFKGTHDVRSMGGLSVAFDSIHLNLNNPATYSRLKRTNFVVGGTTTFNNLSNTTESEKAQRTSLDYLAVGFPIGNKFGAAFGLMPYSSVGYKIRGAEPTNYGQYNAFTGSGGVNRAFAGFAYNVSNELSIGANFQYNFGTIKVQTELFKDDVIYGTRELNSSVIKGVSTDFGVSYKKILKNNLNVYGSFSYAPEAKLNSENARNISIISYLTSESGYINDSEDINVSDNKVVIPSKYNVGFGLGLDRKWFVGVEYIYQENQKLASTFSDFESTTFVNSNKFILGGYFIPKYNSYSDYWKRVNYRAGFRYENTGIVLNTKEVRDYGINFGLGLPVGNNFSNINIGFEYGKRGTTSHNLIEENYFSLNIGLSLSDLWFEKRKYD